MFFVVCVYLWNFQKGCFVFSVFGFCIFVFCEVGKTFFKSIIVVGVVSVDVVFAIIIIIIDVISVIVIIFIIIIVVAT